MSVQNERRPFGIFESIIGNIGPRALTLLAKAGNPDKIKPIYSSNNIVRTLEAFETINSGKQEFEQNLYYSDGFNNDVSLRNYISEITSQVSHYNVARMLIEFYEYTIHEEALEIYRTFLRGDVLTKEELNILRKEITEDHYKRIYPFVRKEYWYGPSRFIGSLPVRMPAKVILSLGECIFLLALNEVYEPLGTLHNLNNRVHRDLIYNIIEKSRKFKVDAESINEAKGLLARLKIGDFAEDYRTVQLEKIFPTNKCMHIATQTPFIKSRLHHAAYIGTRLIVEAYSNRFPDKEDVLVISIKNIYDLLKTARSDMSKIFYIPYENPFTFRIARKRALWAIGKFPDYKLLSNNCESVVSWIFQNEIGPPQHCVVRDWATRAKIDTSAFWNDILLPVVGGKRLTRKLKKI